MKKTFYIHTFGCQSNKSDSERITGDYFARGYTQVSSWKTANEIIINTCAVRQRAEDRVKGLILNIEKFFSKSSHRPKIILTGCMLHHGAKKLKKEIPQIDEILSINEVGFNSPAIRSDKNHAFIPISTGCNSFCTYCIVPYSRGREISRPLDEILKEIKTLAQQGYTEITLLGQNVNSYGLEKTGIGLRKLLMSQQNLKKSEIPTNQSQYKKPLKTPPFVTLLRKINQIKGIKKIHFMTSNPWDFWDELIDEIATNKKIDRFIHLPIQSGSDKILKAMNRGYTSSDYKRLVKKIRKAIPDAVLGTDIIVGFPGETKKDFIDTVKLAKEIDWHVAFIAQYSPRPGTTAWRLYKDEISPQEKKRRWEILDDLINKKNLSIRPEIK